MSEQKLSNLYDDVKRAIAFDQPKLMVELINTGVKVSGTFIVTPTTTDYAGAGIIAEYEIQIFFPATFPDGEPKVMETGGNIPRNEKHHINGDGSCCIVIWGLWVATSKNIDVQSYIDGPLKNYFLGQHHKKMKGEWPFGEEDHGHHGIIKALSRTLGCAEDAQIALSFLNLLSKKQVKGHWACPCGSRKKLRNCCITKIHDLQIKIGKVRANRIRKYMLNMLPPEQIWAGTAKSVRRRKPY